MQRGHGDIAADRSAEGDNATDMRRERNSTGEPGVDEGLRGAALRLVVHWGQSCLRAEPHRRNSRQSGQRSFLFSPGGSCTEHKVPRCEVCTSKAEIARNDTLRSFTLQNWVRNLADALVMRKARHFLA